MIINGDLRVKGLINANSLLFREIIDTGEMTRGINISLMDGRLYYKIGEDNTFSFYERSELEVVLSQLQESIPVTDVSNLAEILQDLEYSIFDLINVTFFQLSDSTTSYLINMNFDSTVNKIKANYVFDKILTSIYKNGYISKAEYQCSPALYYESYYNNNILPSFMCTKFDNSAVSPIDQSDVIQVYMNDLFELSSDDISHTLDQLLIDNSNDSTLNYDSSGCIYNSFFTISWLNYKFNVSNMRKYVSDLLKRIFNNESVLYFLDSYVNIYKQENMTRLKLYFFDYKFLIQYNIFSIISQLKNVFNNTEDYTNQLSQSISDQKLAHADITSFDMDYTAFQWVLDVEEMVKLIFDSDTNFKDKIKWDDLGITFTIHNWNVKDLVEPDSEELDLSSVSSFNYNGNDSTFSPVTNKIHLADGELQLPLIEMDFPLDSYFYLVM